MNYEKKEIKNITPYKNVNNYSTESSKLLVDSILQKWSKLQKIIKERIILKDSILKQQEIDFYRIKEHFINYYTIKLKIRQTYEEIDSLKDSTKNFKKIFFKKNAEEIFLKSLEPIKEFLFSLRNNYDYVIKIIESIGLEIQEKKDNNLQINSIIELFCNQFYDNILIPNPEQEELLILIYKLIEKDISDMKAMTIDIFLNENTFFGKFINHLMRKPELKIFLSRLLSPIILSIEYEKDEINTSIFSLDNNRNISNKIKNLENNYKNVNNFLFNEISKTSVKFKNFLELEEQKEKESKRKNSVQIDEFIDESTYNITYENNNNIDANFEYKEQLSEKAIKEKIINEKSRDLKEFYSFLLCQIETQPNIFNNFNLFSILEKYDIKGVQQEKKNELKKTILFIKGKIDWLLQSLIDKIAAIPYTVKIICKIIYMLISTKFPNSPKYLINSFIGKFIFEKCIFPSLKLESNNIIENNIMSSKTKDILKIMVKILSKGILYSLFKSDETPVKAIFNNYLIEIIPLLNEFYKHLTNVKFPNVLHHLIKKRIKNIDNGSKTNKLYDYFKQNSDEILQLQCICASIDDLLYLINIINKNKQKFVNIKNSDLLFKSLNLIEKDILQEISDNESETGIFFILFNEKYSSKINNLIDKNNNLNTTKRKYKINNNEEQIKYNRFKLCIKNILKGLNSINSKSYTYLNMAISNDKFFTLLQYTLEDIGELNNKNISHQIPLKWYGQYINNNKSGLDSSFKDNDFEKIYNEMIKEESDKLKELNELSAIIIARDGMNLRCCEKIVENSKSELFRIEQAKKYVKIEKFIDHENIEVCIRIKNNTINKEIEAKQKLQKKNQKKNSIFSFGKRTRVKQEKIDIDINPSTIIVTQDFSFCNHKNLEFIEKNNKNNVGCLLLNKRKSIPSHSYSIKEFIQKFSNNPWGEDIINQDKKPKEIILHDIISGLRNDQIYKTFDNYMAIIRKRIRSPSDINKNLFKNLNEKECDNVIEIIENFIFNQIYKYIYPKDFLKEDKEFYEKTICLDWILPKHLEIEKYYIEQLGMAEVCLKKFDIARSLFDKLGYIKDAFTSINNNIKYSEGKTEEAGQDEMMPIFQYILIKAKPKRMRTNINYINCFINEDQLNGQFGYFISQIESSYSFIMNINHIVLKMSKEEFEHNYENAKKRFNIE